MTLGCRWQGKVGTHGRLNLRFDRGQIFNLDGDRGWIEVKAGILWFNSKGVALRSVRSRTDGGDCV